MRFQHVPQLESLSSVYIQRDEKELSKPTCEWGDISLGLLGPLSLGFLGTVPRAKSLLLMSSWKSGQAERKPPPLGPVHDAGG